MIWLLISFVTKKLQSIVTALFIRSKKQIISIVFIPQSYFAVTKPIRLNSTHYFIMKISNKKELRPIAINYLSDIDILRLYESLQKIYCKTIFFPSQWYYCCIRQSFTFLVQSFRKKLKVISTIDGKIWDQTLPYDNNRDSAKVSALNVNILQGKKYYLMIKVQWHSRLSLLIFFLRKAIKNKQKQLKIKEKNKLKL